MKFLSILCTLLAGNFLSAELSYPDFMVSMTRKGNDFYKYERLFIEKGQYNDCVGIQNLEVFRTCYARNVLLASQRNDTYRIPKIIHQIWLGSPVPIKYFAWMSTWMNWLG
jgi:hypothetical protein